MTTVLSIASLSWRRGVSAVVFSVFVLILSDAARAADPLDESQLKFLFTNSEIDAKGGRCSGNYNMWIAKGPTNFKFNFNKSGTVLIKIECLGRAAGARWKVKETGKWTVNGEEICIESSGKLFAAVQLKRETCWTVENRRSELAAFNSDADIAWKIKVTKHPKTSNPKELLVALEKIRSKAVAEQSTPRKSVSGAAADSAMWEAIKYSSQISDFQRYLESYPDGIFIKLAESQIRDLLANQSNPASPGQGDLFAGIEFGTYHALVIGIDNYKYINKLGQAIEDARAVASVLETEYAFKVNLLIDPSRSDIIDALDDYVRTLGSTDNLLIYYAGHGWMDETTDRGYWLPIDAKAGRRSRWLSNADITDTLMLLAAKHVMVVADSCYSGTLTRATAVGLRDKDYLKRMARKKARVAMVSGGLEPVADSGGSGYSPFAKAFIDALKQNTGIVDGTRLFSQIRRPVILNAQQTPEYSDVRNAGHDGGDFLFVRKK